VSEVKGDYTVSVGPSSITVLIETVFHENLTGISLPSYNLVLSGANASIAQQNFTTALARFVPGVSVTNLRWIAYSASNTTQTRISFNVQGGTTNQGGNIRANLEWKAFNVTSDIQASGISINRVCTYLASSNVFGQTSNRLLSWSYYVNGKLIPYTESPTDAANFVLLDFSRLSTPLDTWSQTFQANGDSTTLANTLNENLTAKFTVNEAAGPLTSIFLAGFTNNVQITITGLATVQGNTILLPGGSLTSGLMGLLAILFSAIAIVTVFVERRLYNPNRTWQQKKGRQKQKAHTRKDSQT